MKIIARFVLFFLVCAIALGGCAKKEEIYEEKCPPASRPVERSKQVKKDHCVHRVVKKDNQLPGQEIVFPKERKRNNRTQPQRADEKNTETSSLRSHVKQWFAHQDKEKCSYPDDGPCLRLDRDGNKTERGHYKNSKKEGLWTEWNSNGKKIQEGIYKEGSKDGLWTEWNSKGGKSREGYYLNNREDGLWTIWYENGQVKMKYFCLEDNQCEFPVKGYIEESEVSEKRSPIDKIKLVINDAYIDFYNVECDCRRIEGRWSVWYEDGGLMATGQFKDEKPDGLWIIWSKDGEKLFEGDYHATSDRFWFAPEKMEGNPNRNIHDSEGLINLRYILRDGWDRICERQADGPLKKRMDFNEHGFVEGRCKDKKQEGNWIYWSSKDNKEAEGTFLHGIQNGPWKLWSMNYGISARNESKNIFDGGHIVHVPFCIPRHPNAKPRPKKEKTAEQIDYLATSARLIAWTEEGDFVQGKAHGLWFKKDEENRTVSEGRYTNGIREGEWKYRHANGSLWGGGNYQNGKKDGQWNYYYSSGEKSGEVFYNYGTREGTIVQWYKNGQKASEGEFKNNMKTGLWTFWDEDGKKWQEGIYVDGKREGRWAFWDEDGKLEDEGNYRGDQRSK